AYRVDGGEEPRREVRSIRLVAYQACVVRDEVDATVEDRLVAGDLDGRRMMGRVAVHAVRAARVDQRVGERTLAVRNREAPVAAPVDGRDDDVARGSGASHCTADAGSGGRGRSAEQVHAREILARGPLERYAARLEAEGEDANAPLARDVDVARCRGAVDVLAGAGRAEAGTAEHSQRLAP